MTDPVDSATAAFLFEVGHLKHTKRAGWWIAGVRDPESVAEHSFRVAVIAFVLAHQEGADPYRAATVALFHDLPEARIGDIPSVGKPFIKTAPAADVIAVQTAHLEDGLAGMVRRLVGEFEAKETLEARCAKDADRIECLLQGLEYRSRGFELAQPWVDTMLAAVKTESGRRLAEAAVKTPVEQWWHDIVASYGIASPPTS